ncbi:hypothetical protein DER46DRAFT_615211 [Fusarium sp. MPI-SDFR-AT-0072]|nr:hypothetical protein DER46DRAFT_615211 [Fusarium sp. MPI-SDFR-AT-0072]
MLPGTWGCGSWTFAAPRLTSAAIVVAKVGHLGICWAFKMRHMDCYISSICSQRSSPNNMVVGESIKGMGFNLCSILESRVGSCC